MKELVLKIIKENTLQYTSKFYTSCHDIYVEFANGSCIKIFIPNEYIRGVRYNGCIIDDDIPDNKKEELIYSRMVPSVCESQHGETLENIKARISIVKIGGNINAGT